jgi:hypothetical protein
MHLRKLRKYSKTHVFGIPKFFIEVLGWFVGCELILDVKEVDGKKGIFVYKK